MAQSEPVRRRSTRLPGFAYGDNHAYFLTTCTADRLPLLARVNGNGSIHFTPTGTIVHQTWFALPTRFPGLDLDAFVVMPDHVHGILTLGTGSDGPDGCDSTLTRIVGAFKSLSTIAVNRHLHQSGQTLWQRSFHDRVIRDEEEFNHLCWYIEDNARRWAARVADEV